jgi:molecular chaperone DnaJ
MSAARRDYYEVLGVEPGADAGAIRTAFRGRARTLHPDVSAEPDADDRFRELAEAYSVLSRPASRLLYDRLGYRGRGHGGLAPFARQARRRAEAEAREAAGLAAEIRVGFFEAARGTTTTARLAGTVPCRVCGGRGDRPGEVEDCPSCDGTGRLRRTSSADFGRVLQIERCYRCGGRGRLAPPCGACAGTGRLELRGETLVTIPAGTRDGRRIALADGGEIVVGVLPARREDRAPTGCTAGS